MTPQALDRTLGLCILFIGFLLAPLHTFLGFLLMACGLILYRLA